MPPVTPLLSDEASALRDMANRLRIHCVEATTAAGSGHVTSCASMAEIIAVLFFKIMRSAGFTHSTVLFRCLQFDDKYSRYNVSDPLSSSNDRFILSKGHATPMFYAAWAEAG